MVTMSTRETKVGRLSQHQIRQREHAARKHGVYSFRSRGSENLSREDRSRYSEIIENLCTQEGAIHLLREHAAKSIMVVELCDAYFRDQAKQGKTILENPLLARYATYLNSARLALIALINHLPPNNLALYENELDKIRRVAGEE